MPPQLIRLAVIKAAKSGRAGSRRGIDGARILEVVPSAANTKGLIRHPSTGGSGFVRVKARPQRSMRGSFAKDGQSGSSLPQRAVSRRTKLTHARTGANCGKDALQNRARLEDGIP